MGSASERCRARTRTANWWHVSAGLGEQCWFLVLLGMPAHNTPLSRAVTQKASQLGDGIYALAMVFPMRRGRSKLASRGIGSRQGYLNGRRWAGLMKKGSRAISCWIGSIGEDERPKTASMQPEISWMEHSARQDWRVCSDAARVESLIRSMQRAVTVTRW